MAYTTTTTIATSASNASIYGTIRQPASRNRRTLRKSSSVGTGVATASTPNLNSLFTSHSRLAVRPGLARKGSLATLTQSSLASIPDVSESYGVDTVLNDSVMPPLTPGRLVPEDLSIGDTVEVPGNMVGTIRFIGAVQGKRGVFAGVELKPEFAARGKNSGDVDGISYFATSTPGAGIFLPASKATRRDGPSSIPLTPTGISGGLKIGTQNSTNYTPPTPSLPKFSQSVGPGRAASPFGKKPRASLPRPESPVRRLQMTPGPRPSISTSPSKGNNTNARYVSPTTPRLAQSVRGTAGDPAKKFPFGRGDPKASIGPRSASALGFEDDDVTPTGVNRTKTNGSMGSVSSFNSKIRPPSRANNDDELERLRAQLEDRDKQLREQTAALSEMESTLTELQGLMDQPGGPRFGGGMDDDKDAAQLRILLREKNDKIAMLTSEFDSHRADFRSTIDALEMASTETVRVYESQKKEMIQEIQELTSRLEDVEAVASQLKQLEDLVQDLEEGLEDARRGEAEARGEVEFLRGEVERTRAELRREREKAVASATTSKSSPNINGANDKSALSKELEQKEDEIRGLKAIIHSLSRDSGATEAGESAESRRLREKLERDVSDLRAVLEEKTGREEELERELEMLRRSNGMQNQRQSAMTVVSARRSSLRDSRDTVVLARSQETRSPEAPNGHKRGHTLDTMPESDSYSTATETSTLWCEICETGGHDILTCTNMFGPEGAKTNDAPTSAPRASNEGLKPLSVNVNDDYKPAPLSPAKPKATPVAFPAAPKPMPMPSILDSGPVAGKESGVIDETKWCAICERDGHDSVDCPFEDAF